MTRQRIFIGCKVGKVNVVSQTEHCLPFENWYSLKHQIRLKKAMRLRQEY